ncbi:glutathione S-transferase family protein [Chelativorans sp. Marseille-P2723]|uniref:glutathione S-transferase family protein n=1 Tax=Chelativorans sp. Marseille-P2723 TaxID=2709133 RepID=UPI00156F771C|nr:glutathione S-transferase family protein [Chelativorans sp. Marseille-P2723]
MITLWGRATSANVQIAAWALAELGLDFERRDVGGKFGGTSTPEYGTLNPNRLVPTLQDGDLTMWESAAILRYLGARYGAESFWPADPAKRAALDKWAEWSKTSFQPTFLAGVFLPLFATPQAKRDMAAVANSVARLKSLTGIINSRLSDGPYLSGESICFADVIIGVPLYRYFTLAGFERAEAPNLEAYYQRLTERPAYVKHVMVSYESLRAVG